MRLSKLKRMYFKNCLRFRTWTDFESRSKAFNAYEDLLIELNSGRFVETPDFEFMCRLVCFHMEAFSIAFPSLRPQSGASSVEGVLSSTYNLVSYCNRFPSGISISQVLYLAMLHIASKRLVSTQKWRFPFIGKMMCMANLSWVSGALEELFRLYAKDDAFRLSIFDNAAKLALEVRTVRT